MELESEGEEPPPPPPGEDSENYESGYLIGPQVNDDSTCGRRNLNVTSPVKGVNPGTDKAIRAALDSRPLSVIKSVTREPESNVTSAKLLERLKQNEPPPVSSIIKSKSPEKQKSKDVPGVYEAISPASDDKAINKGFSPAQPPFGAPSSISKPVVSSYSSAGTGVSAMAKPVTTSAAAGFSFGSSSASGGLSFGGGSESLSLPAQIATKTNLGDSSKPGLGVGLLLSSSGSGTPFDNPTTKSASATAVPTLGSASAQLPGFGLGQKQSQSDIDSTKTDVLSKPKESTKDKNRPVVSSAPVSGTSWCVVWSKEFSRFFYHNKNNNQKVWEIPIEVLEEFNKKQQPQVSKS